MAITFSFGGLVKPGFYILVFRHGDEAKNGGFDFCSLSKSGI
jgi:hypothetical protein